MSAEGKTVVSDDHRKVVFSFIRMLQQLDVSPSMTAVSEALAAEFQIDAAGVGGVHDSNIDLLDAFRTALASRQSSSETDEKFTSFLDLLKQKGYFNGTTEGTEEYEQRMSKARVRFNQRNNPYEGMSAEQLKTKGNELMGLGKYKEAIAYYTKAIEADPRNHVYYANRAAAHTHMKDYRSAIIDCEKAITINSTYSKAFSRLGTAYFYESNYTKSVDAYQKACDLEPDNETYRNDLKQAEEKLKAAGPAALGGGGGFGGFPGMMGGAGGMPDFSQMAQLMNNPQFMQAATQMMQNPDFSSLIGQMAGRFGMPTPNPEELNKFMTQWRQGQNEEDTQGNIMTPLGRINKEALERLQRDEIHANPKMRAIMEDVQVNGFAAFSKYMGDPEVMQLMGKMQTMLQNPNNSNGNAGTS
jgi:small glutamine-rich tetratricopeptide repeat-containing protein alpha